MFDSVGDATRCWIKGKQFSLAGLLGDAGQAAVFEGGSLAVFRLVSAGRRGGQRYGRVAGRR